MKYFLGLLSSFPVGQSVRNEQDAQVLTVETPGHEEGTCYGLQFQSMKRSFQGKV
jgi:hypothetical protein